MLIIDQMPYVDLMLEDDGTYGVRYTEEAHQFISDEMMHPVHYYMLEDAREAMYQMSDLLVTGAVI